MGPIVLRPPRPFRLPEPRLSPTRPEVRPSFPWRTHGLLPAQVGSSTDPPERAVSRTHCDLLRGRVCTWPPSEDRRRCVVRPSVRPAVLPTPSALPLGVTLGGPATVRARHVSRDRRTGRGGRSCRSPTLSRSPLSTYLDLGVSSPSPPCTSRVTSPGLFSLSGRPRDPPPTSVPDQKHGSRVRSGRRTGEGRPRETRVL